MNPAVGRAITCIWERYSEPLSLVDIARSAAFSRFHFSRVFKDETGVSPGQFLSAVRIHQAKRLLLHTTSMNVAEISAAVGYASLGSFNDHFTNSVGLSPGRFRRESGYRALDPVPPPPAPSLLVGEVTGMISLPERYAAALVYVGVFDTRIVERRPRAATVIKMASGGPRPYRLARVAQGSWFVHAVAVADTVEPEPWNHRGLLVGSHGPTRVTSGDSSVVSFALRPRRLTDLPILLALPDLDGEPEQPVLTEPSRYQRDSG